MTPMIVAVICGAIGLGIAGLLARYVLKQDQGSDKIRQISAAIKEGALAFLGREYRILVIFVAVVAVILGVVPMLGWWVSLVFALGAVASAMAGFIGMNIHQSQLQNRRRRSKEP